MDQGLSIKRAAPQVNTGPQQEKNIPSGRRRLEPIVISLRRCAALAPADLFVSNRYTPMLAVTTTPYQPDPELSR